MADIFNYRELKKNPKRFDFLPIEVLSEYSVYGKPVDVFSLACVALHIMSHQWPKPTDYAQDHKNIEVMKREKYLQLCTHPSVQKLVLSCLDDHVDQRPEISEVHVRLQAIKTAVNQQLPLAGVISIELFRASFQRKIYLPEIDTSSTETVIGTGAYSQVFDICIHGAQCAAKEINPKLFESIAPEKYEATRACFLNECIFTSQIHHPNVVQVLGLHFPSSDAQLPWLVMERMHISLTSFLEKYKHCKIPCYFKTSILVDVAQGLEFLNGQDIIHGHLSSNKIFITNHIVAKIADLGVAKVIRKYLVGTPSHRASCFMPPESIPVPHYDKSVDVFSLGCVACHVMSNQWPEPKDVVSDDTPNIPMEIRKRAEYIQPYADSSLGKLMQACLVDDPKERSDITIIRMGLEGVKDKLLEDTNQWLASTNRFELIKVTEEEKALTNKLRADFAAFEQKWSNMQKKLDEVDAGIQYIRDINIFSGQQMVCYSFYKVAWLIHQSLYQI